MTRKTTGSTSIEPVCTFADMIDEGWLTPVSFYTPAIPLTTSIWPEAIATYQERAAGKKALVFCVSQHQASEALTHFLDAGIAAAALLADDGPAKRAATLNGFASGSYKVLINVTLALDLGGDPSVEVVIMAAPTRSQSRYEVMVVSAMRPQFAEGMTPAEPEYRRATIASSGKPRAIILDFAGNCQRLGVESFTRRTDTHLTIPGSLEWDQAPTHGPTCAEIGLQIGLQDWNRAQAPPPIAPGYECGVATAALELMQGAPAPTQPIANPDPIIGVLKSCLARGVMPVFSGGDLKHLIKLLESGHADACQLESLGEDVGQLKSEVADLEDAREILRTQLALLNPARSDSCKECGSKALTWFTTNANKSGVQEGRLRSNEITCQFVLGCDDCSETLRVINADTIAARMNADSEHAKDTAK